MWYPGKSHKVSGFLGHTAGYCNKCMKTFGKLMSGSRDYSGYDIQNWVAQDGNTHKQHVNEIGK